MIIPVWKIFSCFQSCKWEKFVSYNQKQPNNLSRSPVHKLIPTIIMSKIENQNKWWKIPQREVGPRLCRLRVVRIRKSSTHALWQPAEPATDGGDKGRRPASELCERRGGGGVYAPVIERVSGSPTPRRHAARGARPERRELALGPLDHHPVTPAFFR